MKHRDTPYYVYVIVLALAFSFCQPAQSQTVGETFVIDDLEYTVVAVGEGHADVALSKSLDLYKGALVIPASLTYLGQTFNIVSIADEAFKYSSISELDMSQATHLERIGASAFAENRGLTKVVFPPFEQSALTEIGRLAFQHCVSISSINLEDTHIEVLESIFTDDENDEVSLEDLRELALPETLKEIKRCALQFLGLRSITFPSGITAIGDRILEGDIYLKEFIWRDAQVTRIPTYFFLGDDALENVTILTVNALEMNGLTDNHFFMCHPDLLTVTVSQPSFENLTAFGYTPGNSFYSTLVADPDYTPAITAIRTVHAAESDTRADRPADTAVYTLQGVRVGQPRRGGIYIRDGRKFVQR